MASDRSPSCPDLREKEEYTRKRALSVKALSNKIENLQKKRQAKVNKIKGAEKVIKGLMQNEDDAQSVQSQREKLHALFDDASKLHDAVVPLLPQEEQERQKPVVFKCTQTR